jgi:hypothetical protein
MHTGCPMQALVYCSYRVVESIVHIMDVEYKQADWQTQNQFWKDFKLQKKTTKKNSEQTQFVYTSSRRTEILRRSICTNVLEWIFLLWLSLWRLVVAQVPRLCTIFDRQYILQSSPEVNSHLKRHTSEHEHTSTVDGVLVMDWVKCIRYSPRYAAVMCCWYCLYTINNEHQLNRPRYSQMDLKALARRLSLVLLHTC